MKKRNSCDKGTGPSSLSSRKMYSFPAASVKTGLPTVSDGGQTDHFPVYSSS